MVNQHDHKTYENMYSMHLNETQIAKPRPTQSRTIPRYTNLCDFYMDPQKLTSTGTKPPHGKCGGGVAHDLKSAAGP